MVTPEFRKASSRSRCSSVFRSNSICEKVSSDGMKVTLVPVSGWPLARAAGPGHHQGGDRVPAGEAHLVHLAVRWILRSSQSESAFTTDTPTPWSPPETL
jgi:hypothetical protein